MTRAVRRLARRDTGCRPRAPGPIRLALSAMLCGLATLAHGQDAWPSRPVTLVVPFAAGGPADVIARVVATPLGERLGRQVIVENVGGAGGSIGAGRVAKAPPDGYQIGLGNAGTHAGNQSLYRHPAYNAATDFEPVILLAEVPLVLLARKDFPASDLPSFIAFAKANRATMQFGSGGVGSTTHLACALFNIAAGIDVTHVPYRGGGLATQDLVGGRIDYVCIDPPVALPLVEGGLAKPIAILSGTRLSGLPDVPNAAEQGLTGFEASNWFALFAPRGTPKPIVDKLHDAVSSILDDPSIQAQMRRLGADIVPADRRTPAYLRDYVDQEIRKWAAPIRAGGLRLD